jgi:hypothetical protein
VVNIGEAVVELNWDWLKDWNAVIGIVFIALALPTYLTLREMLDQLRSINQTLMVLQTRLAPPQPDIDDD